MKEEEIGKTFDDDSEEIIDDSEEVFEEKFPEITGEFEFSEQILHEYKWKFKSDKKVDVDV